MSVPRKQLIAVGVLLVLGVSYFAVLPGPVATIENSECGDGFVLDTGRTIDGKWGPRRQLGYLPDTTAQGVGPVDGEVRGDIFYGPDGLEVEVFWEPHDGLSCAIE